MTDPADGLCERFPKVGSLTDHAEEDVLACMDFAKDHWNQVASTDLHERVHKDSKRRANVLGIFPDETAIVRLVGVLVHEKSDEWPVTTRRARMPTGSSNGSRPRPPVG